MRRYINDGVQFDTSVNLTKKLKTEEEQSYDWHRASNSQFPDFKFGR